MSLLPSYFDLKKCSGLAGFLPGQTCWRAFRSRGWGDGRMPRTCCGQGKRGKMLRTRASEVSVLEVMLPAEVLRLPGELARVDALLDDPVFFARFVPFFDPRMGRPSTPMEVYLRLMS
jgi:IS5 family transposase